MAPAARRAARSGRADRQGRPPAPEHEIADLRLEAEGDARLEWADEQMPVLRKVRERFAAERPLEGIRIAACLHVTAETANLILTLRAGGRGPVAVRGEPALDPGRRRRGAGRAPWRRGQGDPGRGPRHLRRPRQGAGRRPAADHDRRRRRPADDGPPRGRAGAGGSDRRHRGDDDGPPAAAPAAGRGRARMSGAGCQRGSHRARAQRSPRNRSVGARRDRPRQQRAAGRAHVGRDRLRLGRAGGRGAGPGGRRGGDRVRDRPAAGPGGPDGRLRGDARARGGRARRCVRAPSPARAESCAASTSSG